MSEKIISFLITHGNLAFELNEVSQKFLPLNIPNFVYSNQKDSVEQIIDQATNRINEHMPDKIIIFVDLLGGSCWQAAMHLKKNFKQAAILAGVNVPALLSFSTNHNKLEWSNLLKKIEEDSKKAIRIIN